MLPYNLAGSLTMCPHCSGGWGSSSSSSHYLLQRSAPFFAIWPCWSGVNTQLQLMPCLWSGSNEGPGMIWPHELFWLLQFAGKGHRAGRGRRGLEGGKGAATPLRHHCLSRRTDATTFEIEAVWFMIFSAEFFDWWTLWIGTVICLLS